MPPRVFNFGSLNIDRVFRVPHVVTPKETLASRSFQILAGGKGANQSVALARAGAAVTHCGKIGPDGIWLLNKLAIEGVDTRFVVQGETPTGQAFIQVDDAGENAIVLMAGANHEITRGEIDTVLSECSPNTFVLTQNETSNVAYLIERAAALGLNVVFNPAPFTSDILTYPLQHVSLLVVNEKEGHGITGEATPEAILAKLRTQLPKTELILTLGADGVLYDGKEGQWHVPAFKAGNVVDTTAAGDTFIGYYLASRLDGGNVLASLQKATHAAAICIGRVGAMDSIPWSTEWPR